jgi:hypothetical protein
MVEESDALNPMQRAVLDALARSPDWRPLPAAAIDDVRRVLHEGLAPFADRYTQQRSLWLSKSSLAAVHACEASFLATRDSFEWNASTATGTVLHKAIELTIHWRGDPVPSDVVDEALARLADDQRSIGDYIESIGDAERAQLRGNVVDLLTRFEECFPPLKPSWRPVTESSARYELFDGAIVLGCRSDLTLGMPGAKVIVDFKSGGIHPRHREDLRFYALVEAMRSGMAPRRLATYSLSAARADVEEVTEGVLQAAARRVIAAARAMTEIVLDERTATRRPGVQCRWCPLNTECEPGVSYLSGDAEDKI